MEPKQFFKTYPNPKKPIRAQKKSKITQKSSQYQKSELKEL